MMSSFPGGASALAGGPVSAHSGGKEFIDGRTLAIEVRWTQSFPRTRERPDALAAEYPRASAGARSAATCEDREAGRDPTAFRVVGRCVQHRGLTRRRIRPRHRRRSAAVEVERVPDPVVVNQQRGDLAETHAV